MLPQIESNRAKQMTGHQNDWTHSDSYESLSINLYIYIHIRTDSVRLSACGGTPKLPEVWWEISRADFFEFFGRIFRGSFAEICADLRILAGILTDG